MAYIDFTGANNMHNMFRNDYALPWYDITGRTFGNRRLYNDRITEPIEKMPIPYYANSLEYNNSTSYSFDKYLPEKTKNSVLNNTNIGNGLTTAFAALNIADTAFNLGRGEADTTGYQALAKSLADTQFAGTNESLIAQRNSTQDMTRKSYSDIGGISNGKIATSSLGSAISGATTGLTVGGPIGAAIGGVVGLGSGIIGGILGHNKDRAKQRKLNAEIVRSNNIMHNNFDNAVRNNDRSSYKFGMMNQFALGGDLESNDTTFNPYLTLFNEGGSHEENPYGGIPQGMAEDGQPNLVEEGEVKWNNYIFSKRLTVPDNDLEMYKIAKRYKGKSYADIAKDLYKEKADRPVDSISDKTMAANLQKLQMSQEMLKAKQEEQQAGEQMAFALGGLLEHRNNHILADGGDKDKKVYYPMRIDNGDGTYTMATDGYSPVSNTPGYYVMQDHDGNRIYGVPQNEDEWKQVASYYTTVREPVPSEVNEHMPGNRSVGEYMGPSQWMQELNTVGTTPLNWAMMLPVAGTILPELTGAGIEAFGPKLTELPQATKAALKTPAGKKLLTAIGLEQGLEAGFDYLNSDRTVKDKLMLAMGLPIPGSVGNAFKYGKKGVAELKRFLKNTEEFASLTSKELRELQKSGLVHATENAAMTAAKENPGIVYFAKDKDGVWSRFLKNTEKDDVVKTAISGDSKNAVNELLNAAQQKLGIQVPKTIEDIKTIYNNLKDGSKKKIPEYIKDLIQNGENLTENQIKQINSAIRNASSKERILQGFSNFWERAWDKSMDFDRALADKKNSILYRTSTGLNPYLAKKPYKIGTGIGHYSKVDDIGNLTRTYYDKAKHSLVEGALPKGAEVFKTGRGKLFYMTPDGVSNYLNPSLHAFFQNSIFKDRRTYELLGGGATIAGLSYWLANKDKVKPLNTTNMDTENAAKRSMEFEQEETSELKDNRNFADSLENTVDSPVYSTPDNPLDTLQETIDNNLGIKRYNDGSVNKFYANGGLLDGFRNPQKLPMLGSSEWDNFIKSPYYRMLNGGLPTGLSEYNYTPNDMHFVNPADYGDPWKYTQAGANTEHYNPMNISNITDIENSDWYKNNFLNSLKTNNNYLKAVIDGYLGGLPKQGYDNLRKKLALKDDFSNRDSVYNEFVKLATDHKAGLAHNPMVGDRYYWEDKNGKRTYIDKPTDSNFTINPDYTWDGTWRDYKVTMNPKNNPVRKKKTNESTDPQLSSSLTPEGITPEGETSLSNTTREKVYTDPLMFAPVLGDSLNYLNASLTKPDYSDVNLTAPQRINVGWHPIGNYQKYQPVDVDYYINKLDQQRLGTQSLLSNSVNGNQAAYQAGVLQNDVTNRNAVAEAMQAAEAENYRRYNDVTKFNRETDAANQNADITVQGQRVEAEKAFMDALYKYAIARKGVKDKYDTTRAYFGQKMFDDLGSIGKHLYMADALDSEKYRLLYTDAQARNAAKKTQACGGYLTIKTR